MTVFLPRLEEEILLAFALGIPRIKLMTLKTPIPKEKLKKFKALVARRRKHEPIAYIVGNQPFVGLELAVNPAVLIPRPETELLVEKAVSSLQPACPYGPYGRQGRSPVTGLRVLDIGTGSGCIAIALAKYLPEAFVSAVDSSTKALAVARKNARKNRVSRRIKFLHGNLFAPVKGRRFDLIVSNPPYIPTKVIPTLERDVKDYEPISALDGGKDGLDIIRKIVQQAPLYLAPRGRLALEIGFGQAKAIKKLVTKAGFKNFEIHKDLAGIERILIVINRQV